MTIWVFVVLVALMSLAGWALYFALLARIALAAALQKLADETTAKETALALLDGVLVKRTEEVRAATAQLEVLRHKYETTLRLYQDSIAIDGPLASKRVQ